MKTIEISDEMYDKLISLATEMTTQDPRATKMPHMFQIRDWEKRYDFELNGDERILVDSYGHSFELGSPDEFKGYLEEHSIEVPENINDLWNDNWMMEDFIESHELPLRVCSYSLIPIYINCFLTAKAAEEHLSTNYYHYHSKADVYLNHAWRNPEMEMISEFLCGLIGKKIHT